MDILPWLLLGALLAAMWHWRQGWGRHAMLGLGFFFLNLIPALGFVFMNTITMVWSMDHLAYVSTIGIIGLVVAGLD